MIHSTPEDLSKRARQKWIRVTVLFTSFVMILVLAVASYTSTQVMWDGMFPSGEYHLRIQDEAGNPIEGAVLNVYEGRSTKHAFEYPFDNYLSENSLISSADGEIIVTHLPRGLEFGGSGWYLFWFIPMGIGGPEFTFQIAADRYETFRSSTQQIFDMAYEAYNNGSTPRKTVQINGNEYQIMILEKSIILKKK